MAPTLVVEKISAPFTVEDVRETTQKLSQTPELVQVLTMQEMPTNLTPYVTEEYFHRIKNNFHLRLIRFGIVRQIQGKQQIQEIEEFFGTSLGKQMTTLSAYYHLTHGISIVNYFTAPKDFYSIVHNEPEKKYSLIDAVEEEIKHACECLTVQQIQVDPRVMERKVFLPLLEKHLAPYDISKIVSGERNNNFRDIFERLGTFNNELFQRISRDEINKLLFVTYQYCLAKHLEQPGIREILESMTEKEIGTYLWVRYFR